MTECSLMNDEQREYFGVKKTAHLGTLNALVRCRWFRAGWSRAHANHGLCLQTHEERMWRRAQIADKRTWRAMQAHDAANMVGLANPNSREGEDVVLAELDRWITRAHSIASQALPDGAAWDKWSAVARDIEVAKKAIRRMIIPPVPTEKGAGEK